MQPKKSRSYVSQLSVEYNIDIDSSFTTKLIIQFPGTSNFSQLRLRTGPPIEILANLVYLALFVSNNFFINHSAKITSCEPSHCARFTTYPSTAKCGKADQQVNFLIKKLRRQCFSLFYVRTTVFFFLNG